MIEKRKTVTIIGGGLGGLTSGALLAQDGYKVTLLEQHNIVGGCATAFKRKGGFTCEVGLHEMDGVYSSPQIKKIFDALDIYNHVAFVKPDEFFSVMTKNGTFIMPDNLQEAQNKLTEKFPNDQNIKELVEYSEAGTSKTVQRYIKTPHGTAYGFKPTPQQFFRIPKTKSDKINDLYFVGQWVIAGGFSPAVISGGLCYEAICQ